MRYSERQLLHILKSTCARAKHRQLCTDSLYDHCWDGTCHSIDEVLAEFCRANNIVIIDESALEGNTLIA